MKAGRRPALEGECPPTGSTRPSRPTPSSADRTPAPTRSCWRASSASRDEAAFAALVVRHTPAVRAACRGWLRSPADVDDAAQATFLVLVRRADSIRDRAALPRWLYRVAANVARRLRRQLTKAGPLPADVPDRDPPAGRRPGRPGGRGGGPAAGEVPAAGAVVLRGRADDRRGGRAARLAAGTVLTRLARGRELARAPAGRPRGGPGGVLATLPAARAVAPAWVRATTRAAKGLLAGASPAIVGVSQRTVTLTEGVVRAMTWNNLRAIAAVAMLATGLIGFVVGQWASGRPGAARPANRPPPAAPATRRSRPPALPAKAAKADEGSRAPAAAARRSSGCRWAPSSRSSRRRRTGPGG